MRIGRQKTHENIVFSLEKVDPSSSSSEVFPPEPSSSSQAGSSSSSQAGSSSSSQAGSSSSSQAGSSSSSQAGSSSSSQAGSSSSSVLCGPFNYSLTTQLGANSDIPEMFYAEAIGVSLVSVTQPITLQYDNLDVSGPAFIMDIQIGDEIVAAATVAFGIGSQLYLDKPFALSYGGSTYCGVFTNGTVVF